MGGQIKKLTSGLERATSEILVMKSTITGSTRREIEDDPEALVRKFVTQDKTQTLDSARRDFNEVAKRDNRPHWISWAPERRGRSRMLFWLM